MPESSSEETGKPSPAGPGLAVYLGVGAVLAVSMGVLQIKAKTKTPEKKIEQDPWARPSTTSPPQKTGALPAVGGPTRSVGFVKGSGGQFRGVAHKAGRTEYEVSGLARQVRSMLKSMDAPPLTMSGEGGPARFEGRLLNTRKQWDAMWRSVGGHDMPEVDFKRQMGVVVFSGDQPQGTVINIKSAKPSGGIFLVEYQILKPITPRPGTRYRTYQAIITARSKLPPAFKKVP